MFKNKKQLYTIRTKNHEYVSCIVYGLYDVNGNCFYIGKTYDIKEREKQHKAKFKQEIQIKKLKVNMQKNINWEKVYIQWYSLKYNLTNKKHNLHTNKVSRMDKTRLSINYYPKYQNRRHLSIVNKYHLL